MGLKLTKADDYAVRAMIHLACLPEGSMGMRSDVAEAQGIPSSFMAKILRSLVRAKLLRSSRGVNGGFALARPASEITLLDIVEAVEGPLRLAECVPDPDGCTWSRDCPAAPVWLEVQQSVKEILSEATLEKLVSQPRRNGQVVSLADFAEGGLSAHA